MSSAISRSMISPGRRPAVVPAIVLALLIAVAKCGDNHIPTLNEISRINDPVLKEVFASSGIRNRSNRPDFDDHPRLPPMAPEVPTERVYGEVPIEHNQQPLGPVPSRPDQVQMAVDTGVNALANGADVFYRGAASVGQAFGINTQAYESPLFSAASQFLGRK